jgi:CheY-like chemotaxis protein
VAEEDSFAVAMLDMQMPDMDGETLGRKIKEQSELADTILVMLTSWGQRGDAAKMKEIGFAAYLTKPVKESEIHDCLMTVMGRKTEVQDKRFIPIVTKHSLSESQKRRIGILVVEDDVTNQKVALHILEKLGYRANAVGDGQEAIRALEAIPYDLVLMDVNMPEMDGLEATRMIRDPQSKVLNHQISIVAMTALAVKGDRERCLEAGMNGYVSKPVQPQELLGAIEGQLLGGEKGGGSPPAKLPAHDAKVLPGGSASNKESRPNRKASCERD